jgi:hypothetical protein
MLVVPLPILWYKVFETKTLGLDFAYDSFAGVPKIEEFPSRCLQSPGSIDFRSQIWRSPTLIIVEAKSPARWPGFYFLPDLRLSVASRVDVEKGVISLGTAD